MGRTIPTHRMAVDLTERKFKDFRRALRPVDCGCLDTILDYARQHGDAGTMVNIPNKIDVVLISAMLELVEGLKTLRQSLTGNGNEQKS